MLARAKAMLGRLSGRGGHGAPWATWTSREWVFPEYEAPEDGRLPHSFFDPSSLLLRAERPIGIAEEHELVRRGELKEAKQRVQQRLWHIAPSQRVPYILRVTSGLHELRHVHDYLGTSHGFDRIVRSVTDAIEFNRMWDTLRDERRIRLPLAAWGRTDSAPPVLRSYLATRRAHVEWVNVYDGSMTPIAGQGKHTDDVTLLYGLSGLQTAVPAVPVNYVRPGGNEVQHRVVPLGARAIVEGSAFVVQRIAGARLLGNTTSADWLEIKRSQMQGPRGDYQWMYYMAVDFYLSRQLERYYEAFQLAVSDLALMPSSVSDIKDAHPGWRLVRAAGLARQMPPRYAESGANLDAYVDQIAQRAGWLTTKEAAARSAQTARQMLKHLAGLKEAQTLWPLVLRAVYNIHLTFMELRQRAPSLLADPNLYLEGLGLLPGPPIASDGLDTMVYGATEQEAAALDTWLQFNHIRRHLLFSTKLPCPGPRGHRCDGDPLRRRKWKASEACPFARLVEQMRIPGMDMRTA